MPCERNEQGGWSCWQRTYRCACGAPATKLCDHPSAQGTCDAPICERCARTVKRGVHWCPQHPTTPVNRETLREKLGAWWRRIRRYG